jgi:osmotically-inducible protein OsmY
MASVTETPEHADGTPAAEAGPPAPPVDAILAALDKTGHGWLRRIVVTAEGGSIVLRGRVPSFYLKQMAQVIALAVPGVAVLRNELQVQGGNP